MIDGDTIEIHGTPRAAVRREIAEQRARAPVRFNVLGDIYWISAVKVFHISNKGADLLRTQRTLSKSLIGASIVVASFAISLWAMNYLWPLCPPGVAAVALQGPFARFPEPGVAYIASFPIWNTLADSSDNPNRSNTLVCENNFLLGPAHSTHHDYCDQGPWSVLALGRCWRGVFGWRQLRS